MIKEEKLNEAMELLNEATSYFGPCWCKKSIDYICPQCEWREKYDKLCKKIKFDILGNMK